MKKDYRNSDNECILYNVKHNVERHINVSKYKSVRSTVEYRVQVNQTEEPRKY